MNERHKPLSWNPITWVLNGLTPADLRHDKPVMSRYSAYDKATHDGVPEDWKRPVDFPPQFFSRHSERHVYRKFCPASRCREWSTLREMLPAKSNDNIDSDPNKDGDTLPTESIVYRRQELLESRCGGTHPVIYSQMSKYVDEQMRYNVLQRLF